MSDRAANAEESIAAFAEHIGQPLLDWQRDLAAGMASGDLMVTRPGGGPRRLVLAAESGLFTPREPRAATYAARWIVARRLVASAFGLSLLDVDAALRETVRRDHVVYRKRQLARRRRKRR